MSLYVQDCVGTYLDVLNNVNSLVNGKVDRYMHVEYVSVLAAWIHHSRTVFPRYFMAM